MDSDILGDTKLLLFEASFLGKNIQISSEYVQAFVLVITF